MDTIPETKKGHLWRKTVWHTDPDLHPLGPHHFADVYCCEEANGYAVWYVRRLPKDGPRGSGDVDNGDYLLGYFSPQQRDAAIERAVLLANADAAPERVLEGLDRLAAGAQKV